jgi:hypothetical protein
MGIEGCDCSEFERREGYISCESLMAGQISSLKGKSMSRDLTEMDQREYVVIKGEEADLKTVRENEWKNVHVPFRENCLTGLVASIIGVVCGVIFNSYPLLAASTIGVIGSLLSLIISGDPTEAQVYTIRDIDDNRLARLRNKVAVLEVKIETANECKEELRSARDFFKTKYDLYLS